MPAGKRGVGLIAGAGLSLAVQQAAYQVWKAELGGFWWPLAQFFAVQLLVGVWVERAIRYALHSGGSDKQRAEGRGRGPAGRRSLAKPFSEGILELLQAREKR